MCVCKNQSCHMETARICFPLGLDQVVYSYGRSPVETRCWQGEGACRLLASPQLECEWVLDVHRVIVLFCLILDVFLVDLKHLLYCPGLGL